MSLKIKIIVTSLFMCFLMAISSYADTKQVAVELDAVVDEGYYYSPGDTAKYQLTVQNLLGDSWIRVKFKFSKKSVDEDFSDKNLHLLNGWEKHGEYYYYMKKADARTNIPVVNGVDIPKISNGKDGMQVTVSVDADAVQYDVFSPNFRKDNPWDGAEIKHGSSSHSSEARILTSDNGIRVYSAPSGTNTAVLGKWNLVSKENHCWTFTDSAGNSAKNGWVYVYNPYSKTENKCDWFHFNENGDMTRGWYLADNGLWYYTHDLSDGDLGKLETGWHHDVNDGKTYYLDPMTGIMLTGLQEINGKTYYFTSAEDVPYQSWFLETKFGKWLYKKTSIRPYGSLYVNRKIPDGRMADENGEVH